jgi:hypothetical protein
MRSPPTSTRKGSTERIYLKEIWLKNRLQCSANNHVRFTPKGGHVQCKSVCPLCANSGLMQRSKMNRFDHLVGAGEVLSTDPEIDLS